MKKPTKPNTSKSKAGTSKTSSRARHSKSAKKPVTIDLKAEKVEKPVEATKKTTAASAVENNSEKKSETPKPAAEKAKPKTSVPKSTKSAGSLDEIAEKKEGAEKGSQASEPKSESKADAGNTKNAKTEEAKKPSQPARTKPVATSSQKSGTGGKIAAGIVGGIIALGGATALQYSGVLPNTSSSNTSDSAALTEMRSAMDTRIAELEGKLAVSQNQSTAEPDLTTVNAAIDKRIAELESKLQTGEDGSEAAAAKEIQGQIEGANAAVSALKDQLAATDKSVEDLKAAISGGAAGDDAAVAALKTQLETVSASVASLTSQVKTLAEKPANVAAPETASALESLQAAIPALENKLNKEISGVSDKISTIEASVSETAAKLPNMSETIEALKNGATAFQEKLASVEKGLSEQTAVLTNVQSLAEAGQKKELAAAQAIAAAALKNDIDRGLPFEQSLATLQNLAPDNVELKKLTPLAGGSVPTVAQLTAEFETVGETILSTLSGPKDDSLSARLLAGAKSLVKVKPLRPQEGTSPAALVSQIEGALRSENLASADTIWKSLPEAGQAASKGWHDKLVARITANSIIADIVQSFVLTNVSQ